MKKLTAFWRTCDRMAAATVMKEWELEIREPDVLAVARQLLIPTDRESAWYPCVISPRCGCSHEVFTHRDGDKVAVCACDEHDCYTFPVKAEDLVVYELNFARVFRALGKVMGFDHMLCNVPEVRFARSIGEFTPSPGRRVPVYFVRYVGAGGLAGVIHDLALAHTGPFVCISITIPRRDPSARQVADHYGALLLSLEELVFGNDDGTPGIDTRVKAVVDSFITKATIGSVVTPRDVPDKVTHDIPEAVFRHSDGFHSIWIHGRKLPALSDMQADMVRVLHEAALEGETDLRFAAIASRMGEPPGRFDNVFRADDPRREIIRTVRRGVFRLNV